MFYVAYNSFNRHLIATVLLSSFNRKINLYCNLKKSISKCNKKITYKSVENSPKKRKTQSISSTMAYYITPGRRTCYPLCVPKLAPYLFRYPFLPFFSSSFSSPSQRHLFLRMQISFTKLP